MALQEKSICFISPFMGPLLARGVSCGTGGAERQFYLFGTELAKRGWRVVFIADCPTPSEELPENVHVIHVPFKHIGGRKGHMLTELPLLLFALMRAHTRYYVIKTAPHLAAVVCAFKVVFSCDLIMWGQTDNSFDKMIDYEPKWLRWIRNMGIKRASLLVAQTREQSDRAMSSFGRHAIVIPNITIKPSSLPVVLHEPGYIFWCGNCAPNKRAEIFVELAKLLPKLRFVMAMNGDEAAERYQMLREAAQKIHNLLFLGSVPGVEIDRWFGSAGVYVNTSIREGFPNTYLQAFQQGCPVVTINIDPDGILEKNKLGFCLDKTQAHLGRAAIELATDLVPVIEGICATQERRKELSTACREYVVRTHYPDRVIPLFEKTLFAERT